MQSYNLSLKLLCKFNNNQYISSLFTKKEKGLVAHNTSSSESGDIKEEFDFSALLDTAGASINDQTISHTFYHFECMTSKFSKWQHCRLYFNAGTVSESIKCFVMYDPNYE
jgi:hypothetical protein